jgi:hypothetical protein
MRGTGFKPMHSPIDRDISFTSFKLIKKSNLLIFLL